VLRAILDGEGFGEELLFPTLDRIRESRHIAHIRETMTGTTGDGQVPGRVVSPSWCKYLCIRPTLDGTQALV